MSRPLVVLLIAAAGFGLGAAYGRFVSPVQYVDADPASMRVDYRSDYVLMVAERYAADHDVAAAISRLTPLSGASPERVCAEAIQFARSARYAPDDVALLEQLLRAVQAHTLQASTSAPPP